MPPIPRLCSRLLFAVLFLLPVALEAQTVRVGGRVVNPEGLQGAAGVRIELLPASEDYAAAVRRLRGEPESKPLATARSDAEGFFEIAAPEAGAYRVRIVAEGHLTFEQPLVPLIEDTSLGPVPLLPTEPFEIRALTREGRPIPGVAIRSFSDLAGYSGWREEEDRGGVTGADGRLVLRRMPGERLNLIAISPAFLGQSGIPPEDGRPVVLTPRPALHIEVRNADGKPVPDALVRWRSKPVGLTGPDGRLEVALPPGDEPLTVESREGHWATISARPADSGSVLSVRLAPPRIVTGRVVSAISSAPLPQALVWAGGLPDTLVRTAADGGFRLALRTSEEVTLEAAAANHLQPESRFIPPSSSQPIVLNLEPAARISGRVVDEEGHPVSGVELKVMPELKSFTPPVLSRADGSFQFSGLACKGSYEIQGSRQGFLRSSVAVRTPPPGQPPVPVRLILKSGQTAFGRVTSEAGTPVAGAELALSREPLGSSEIFRALADVEGRFEIHALEAGRFTLWVLGKGFPPFHRTVQIPTEPNRADLGVIALPAGAWIEGQVTDTHGTPIAAARIWTEPDGLFQSKESGVETGPDGRFRALGHRGKPTELAVWREGYLPLQVPGVEAPTPEVLHLELKAARSLSGRVVGPGGEPVANATLMRIAEIRLGDSTSNSVSSSSSLLGRTDAQGGFHVSGLEPGATDLQVSAEGYSTRRVRGIPIPQDRDLEGLEIVLSRWNVLRIRVLSPDGGPVAGASLSAEPEPARQVTNVADLDELGTNACLTDERGTCQAEIREPGSYRVSAVLGQRTAASVLVQAGPGTTPVELRIPKAHKASGRVTDRQGRGLAGATVRLTDDRRSIQETPTRGDGAFAFQDLADGSYELAAKRQGFLQSGGPRELRVEGADVPGLEIQLSAGEEGATLTGRLLGLTPDEVGSVKVRAFSSDGWPEEVDAEADGRYRISGLSPGDWNVQAQVGATNRWLQAMARIEPGASEAVLDFDFGKGFTLSGRVLVDGEPWRTRKLPS